MNAWKLLLTVIACGLVLGGCSNASREDNGLVIGAITGGLIGNSVGRGRGRVVSTAIGAFVGGIVGSSIGRALDEEDRYLAQRAEYDALERGRSGERSSWRNPKSGHYGEVVPEMPYRRGSYDCRNYTHRIYIDGRPEVMRGTACRNPDGTWSPV
ncbi:MAG: glycine zipper 2TM domain-containing protein [Hyphomicrobiaceae bacterium]|nr:glycine zipper 2TM domain-containing protein [Hyphomicrobiaceae bacterium]